MVHNAYKILALSLCGVLMASPALADPGNGKGKGRGHDKDHVVVRGDHDVRIVIGDNDRSVIRSYLREKNCPPGLAKKNNGCLPPGHAKQYSIGDVFVVDERPRSIWHALADMISPPPAGHRYVRTDTDVLLISESNNRIVDIVSID